MFISINVKIKRAAGGRSFYNDASRVRPDHRNVPGQTISRPRDGAGPSHVKQQQFQLFRKIRRLPLSGLFPSESFSITLFDSSQSRFPPFHSELILTNYFDYD